MTLYAPSVIQTLVPALGFAGLIVGAAWLLAIARRRLDLGGADRFVLIAAGVTILLASALLLRGMSG